jgi:hypothetical protein
VGGTWDVEDKLREVTKIFLLGLLGKFLREGYYKSLSQISCNLPGFLFGVTRSVSLTRAPATAICNEVMHPREPLTRFYAMPSRISASKALS